MDSPQSDVNDEIRLHSPSNIDFDATKSPDVPTASRASFFYLSLAWKTIVRVVGLLRIRPLTMPGADPGPSGPMTADMHDRNECPNRDEQSEELPSDAPPTFTAQQQADIDDIPTWHAALNAREREQQAARLAQSRAEGAPRICREDTICTGIWNTPEGTSARDVLCVGLLVEEVIEEVAMSDIPEHQPECPISYEPYERPVRTTLCGHFFCAACVSEWLLLQRSCPFCRRELLLPDGSEDMDSDSDSEDSHGSEGAGDGSDEDSSLAYDEDHDHSDEELDSSDESVPEVEESEDDVEESENDVDESVCSSNSSDYRTADEIASENGSDLACNEYEHHLYEELDSSDESEAEVEDSDQISDSESYRKHASDNVPGLAVDESDYYIHERLPSYLVARGNNNGSIHRS